MQRDNDDSHHEARHGAKRLGSRSPTFGREIQRGYHTQSGPCHRDEYLTDNAPQQESADNGREFQSASVTT
jgi:hypothetical protein